MAVAVARRYLQSRGGHMAIPCLWRWPYGSSGSTRVDGGNREAMRTGRAEELASGEGWFALQALATVDASEFKIGTVAIHYWPFV
jgi:hypothetical protein